MFKKILKFVLIVFVVALISFGASLLWSRRKGGESGRLLERFNGASAEYYQGGAKARKLTSEDASFPFLNPRTKEILYYHSRTGDIKVIAGTSSDMRAKATIKPRATNISWSRDGEKLVATYVTGSILYNLADGTSKSLDAKIISPVFSATSDEIAYLYFDKKSGTGNISIADSQFNNFKTIFKTRLQDWEIYWNHERRLSLIATPGSGRRRSLFLLEREGGKFAKLIDSQDSLKILWSPDGQHLLYSRGTSKSELFALHLPNPQSQKIPLKTEASKCAWSADNRTVVCAVPGSPGSTTTSEDAFFRFDTKTSAEPILLASSADSSFVDAHHLLYVSPTSVVFQNLKDGRLYALSVSE